MAEFNSNDARSAAGRLLFEVRRIISESEPFQELGEFAHSVEADEHIWLGASEEPWNGDRYTPDELANRFCELFILWGDSPYVVTANEASHDTPDSAGQLMLVLFRFLREAEIVEQGRDLFITKFLDRCAWLSRELLNGAQPEAGAKCRLQSVAIDGCAYSERKQQTETGGYAWCQVVVEYGEGQQQ